MSGKFQNLVQIFLHCLHRPSVEMTSLSGATKWKAASRHAFPTPSSGALWSIQAPIPRASPSTSRSQNELSSPTSPCEPRFTQCKQSSERGRYNWTLYFLQECEWDNVCGLSEGEDGGQEPVCSGQSEKQGSRHHQVQEQNSLSVSTPLCSLSVKLFCFFCFTGLIPRTWKPLKQRSMCPRAAILNLSCTTRRWCTGSWISMSIRCTCSQGGWCHSSRWEGHK